MWEERQYGILRPISQLRPSGFLFRLVKPFAAKSKHSIGSCPVILPGDCRSQFHQLRRREPLLQSLPQFGSHLGGRSRNGVCQFQDQLFIGRKEIAFRIPVQIADLVVAQACPSAPGRVNVDSKRAFHQLGRANLSQDFQLRRNQVGFLQRHAELGIRNQHVRVRGNRLQRRNVFA
jgi:hypothetical protein